MFAKSASRLGECADIVDALHMDTPWECIVIGGGAAGLSAALVLGRARRRTLLIDAGRQSNLAAHGIGGFLGQDGRPAPDFYADGRAELAKYPAVEVRRGEATSIEQVDGGFGVTLVSGETVATRRIVLATGTDYRPPAIAGVAERFGRSVFHCPFCHGWEVRDGALAVVDPSPAGASRAILLRAWSDDVTLLTNGPAALEPPQLEQLQAAGIAIDEREIGSVSGAGDTLEAIDFSDGTSRACTGLLVPVTLAQRGGLAAQLGAEPSTEGFFAGQTLAVDAFGQTTVPGVWAAGDASTMGPSVAGAVESGARAAAGIVHAITAELAAASIATS